VLAVLRREAATRQRAPQTIAVFADPVFSRQDARVRPGVATAPVLTAEVKRGGELQRVLTARDEADKIAELASGAAFVARDFDANRSAVLQTDLRPYRILHFATHGWVDDTHPDLSWLALSMVDKTGEPHDGYLRLHEIYNLKLNAELVVLSACETALGKEVKGEGLLGLTRGFMYAGTPRVVASLWQVNGVATSNLMQVFYRRMLRPERKLSPSAALRAAQLEIKKQWPEPYYWGAFVLQGEWR
jgi:CHAT domain-containing protein